MRGDVGLGGRGAEPELAQRHRLGGRPRGQGPPAAPAHTTTHDLHKPWELRNYLTPEEEAIRQLRREWDASLPRRYEATEQRLRTVADAVHFPDLGAELWSGWADATSVDSEPAESRLTDRALAADTTLCRELTLIRHTVHAARDHEVWVVADTLRFRVCVHGLLADALGAWARRAGP
ncbi:hypothetical protein [Streptomyces roseoverticillatus]|uniref:Uncharacterized protein n=1 Tax=Streptomyces roseoverticillatus TaxID=66429 RepID=A0ABV3J316_9ACTN